MARHGRDLGARSRFFELDLVAHRRDGFWIGPDEDDPRFGKRLGKCRALRQKPIARMHRFGAARLAGGHDGLDHQIALRGWRRTDRHRLIGHLHMQRIAVGFGKHRNRRHTHAARGFDDPARDLTAIGNQDALEHCVSGFALAGLLA